MTTTLITGADKGLGYETARQLIAAGHAVYLGSRDPERGKRAADELGASPLEIDVTDDASVAAAARTIDGLDVLINNAGISGPRLAVADYTASSMRELYDTNVLGVVRVTHAFLPLLQQSEETRPYAIWLQTHLDYLDASGEWRRRMQKPPPRPGVPAPPPASPTPEPTQRPRRTPRP